MTQACKPTRNDGQATQMPPFIIKAIFIASLGGILFGYDLGVVSAALPQLTNSFDLTDIQEEMVVSFLYIGGIIGASLGGMLCDVSGRKRAILITDIFFIIGSISLFFADSFEVVLLGRIIVGFAIAVSGIADVAYLHEISPVEWRGAVVSVNEACISFGFLVSYVTGYGVTLLDPDNGWRIMFGLSSGIALIQFGGMLLMPESPVWLTEMGRRVEAESVLQLMYGKAENNVPDSFSPSACSSPTGYLSPAVSPTGSFSSKASLSPTRRNNQLNNATMDLNKNSVSSKNGLSCKENRIDLDMDDYVPATSHVKGNTSRRIKFPFTSLPNSNDGHPISKYSCGNGCVLFFIQVSMCYRQIIIALFLTTIQQFCGHPNILNFASNILAQVGFESSLSTLIITMVLGLVKFIVTCCVIWKIDYFGRRPLLLFGMGTIIVSLFMLFIAYDSINDDGEMSSWGKYMAIIGIFGVVAGYGGSFGPLTWLLVSELFPSKIRGRALGVSAISSHISAVIVSYTFLTWQSTMGLSAPFAIYFVLTALSIVFAYVAIPETGGKDFDQIAEDMDHMRFWNICRRRSSMSSAPVMTPVESSAVII